MSPVSGFQHPDESLVYLCYAVSKEDGSFSFYSLPSGGYTVVSEWVSLCTGHCGVEEPLVFGCCVSQLSVTVKNPDMLS